MPRSSLLVFAAVLTVGWMCVEPAPTPADASPTATQQFLAKWCIDCHGSEGAEAELYLEGFDPTARDLDTLSTLRKVRERIDARLMPPAEFPQPDAEERRSVLAGLDRLILAGAEALPPDPGRVTVRRLSRVEYANTVRDLLSVDFEPSDSFPADDLGYGFDNIGDVLSLSPLLLEKYAAAAEQIALEAVHLEPETPPVRRFQAETMEVSNEGAGRAQGDVFNLWSNGELSQLVTVPRDGDYVLRAFVYGEQAGPEPARMDFVVDGKTVRTLDVPETYEKPATPAVELRLTQGRHTIGVAFVNDYYRPDDPDPAQRDRNMHFDWVELEGPVDELPVPASHRRLFANDPGKGTPARRAKPILEDLCSRAWRRPVTGAEVKRLTRLVEGAIEDGSSFEAGIQLALRAALVSPHFLFRLEPGAATGKKGTTRPLRDYALATRLSYFLWSSMPDDELFALAKRRKLREPPVLAAQVERMLADPKASSLATNFAVQWLELHNLDDAQPDPERFPGFDEALRRAMRRESELFIDAIVREERDVREIVDADFTFMNGPLAAHYGYDKIQGPAFRRVELEGKRRGGVLSHAGVLTVTSNPTRTSPVKRGKWVLENLLDAGTPPPPPGADSLDEEQVTQSARSLREQLERHRAKPECAVCHDRMDALGFALENYDAVGKWRHIDGGKLIDASGVLPGGRELNGAADLKAVLRKDRAFLRCLTKKLFTFAVGRNPTPADELAIYALAASLPHERVTMRQIILRIVELPAFRLRKVRE